MAGGSARSRAKASTSARTAPILADEPAPSLPQPRWNPPAAPPIILRPESDPGVVAASVGSPAREPATSAPSSARRGASPEARHLPRMKRSTLIVLALLGAGATAGIAWLATRPKARTKIVTNKAERLDELRQLVAATGEIRAKEFVDIQAEVAGIITEVFVAEGDVVDKGTVLLRLDDLQLRADLDAAKAQLGAAHAEAKSAEVAIATAMANLASDDVALASARLEAEQTSIAAERADASFRRKKELFEQGLLGSEEFEIADADARIANRRVAVQSARVDQAKANRDATATRIEAAKAAREAACKRVEAAEAAVARAEDLLQKTVLRAPLSGVITKRNVEKGERAVPGIQSNPIATLMTIADMSIVEAELRVDEADIVTVTPGAPATVEVDALRDQKFHGIVTEIGLSPIQTSNTGNGSQNLEGKDFKVVVRLEAPPLTLRPGFTATADIVTAVRKDVLVVPLQALTARELERAANGGYVLPPEPKPGQRVEPLTAAQRQRMVEVEGVFLLRDGRARFRPIKTGITGDMDIEVLGGLEAGDEVITGPYQALRMLREWDPVVIDEKRQQEAQIVRKKR